MTGHSKYYLVVVFAPLDNEIFHPGAGLARHGRGGRLEAGCRFERRSAARFGPGTKPD